MSVNVLALQRPDGWALSTDDAFRDELAGPFETLEQAMDAATELEFTLTVSVPMKPSKHAKPGGKKVGDLRPMDMFRIKDHWYRYRSKSGNKIVVDVVGGVERYELSASEKIDEISVLSLV